MQPPIPHPSTALHLYRHLLREATYLPTLCRPWITERVRTRYRECEHDHGQRLKVHIKDAHGDLRYLRSANAGHIDRLRHLCFMSTGRVGKRKRLLAQQTFLREPAESSTALALESSFLPVPSIRRPQSDWDARWNGTDTDDNRDIMNSPDAEAARAAERSLMNGGIYYPTVKRHNRTPWGKDWLDGWDLGKLKQMAVSQQNAQKSTSQFGLRSTWDPDKVMKKVNCYGFPIAPRTERIRQRIGWKQNLKQLVPPLPGHEWDTLQQLSLGQGAAEDYILPPRRKIARKMSGLWAAILGSKEVDSITSRVGQTTAPLPGTPSHQPSWFDVITRPMRDVQRGTSRKMKSLATLPGQAAQGAQEHPAGDVVRPIGTRVITPRLMRRMVYKRVFEACPRADAVPEQPGHLKITWSRAPVKLSSASSRLLPFFDWAKESNKGADGAANRGRGKNGGTARHGKFRRVTAAA